MMDIKKKLEREVFARSDGFIYAQSPRIAEMDVYTLLAAVFIFYSKPT